MAEIVDQNGHSHDVPSQGKANSALSLGIIGTSLAGLMALGGLAGGVSSLFGRGATSGVSNSVDMSSEDLYNERKAAEDRLAMTTEMYENKLTSQRELTNAFFDAYKRDIDNSFNLYKSQRDSDDVLNQKIIDNSFNLYKNSRDEKDTIIASQYAMKDSLLDKINTLQSQVDVMSAIRPYQDALINAKIDKNAILADFNLTKKTSRMIEGTLMLPDNVISGFTSYTYES